MARPILFALDHTVEIVAHRGYSAVAPENTVAALTRALDEGATAVEFDPRKGAMSYRYPEQQLSMHQ